MQPLAWLPWVCSQLWSEAAGSTHSSIAIQGAQGKGARSAVPLTVYGRAQGGEGHAAVRLVIIRLWRERER